MEQQPMHNNPSMHPSQHAVLKKVFSLLLTINVSNKNEFLFTNASFIRHPIRSYTSTSSSNCRTNSRPKDHFISNKNSYNKRSPLSFFMTINDNDESSSTSNVIHDDTATRNNEPPPNKNTGIPERRLSTNSQQKKKPTSDEVMAAMGTSPRRLFVSFSSSIGIALAANFLGLTSHVLTLFPEDFVEGTNLDTYYPRGDWKRLKSDEYKYTFLYPKEWVADIALELLKQQQLVRKLDYSMSSLSSSSTSSTAKPKSPQVIPDAAFGPPGNLNSKGASQSDTNVSIIVSKSTPGFTLQKVLGTPEVAANFLLEKSIAPPGSGRIATLIHATEEIRSNVAVYQFEYCIDRGEGRYPLRSISVITERGGVLLTLTVIAPEKDWGDGEYALSLRKIASSFKFVI